MKKTSLPLLLFFAFWLQGISAQAFSTPFPPEYLTSNQLIDISVRSLREYFAELRRRLRWEVKGNSFVFHGAAPEIDCSEDLSLRYEIIENEKGYSFERVYLHCQKNLGRIDLIRRGKEVTALGRNRFLQFDWPKVTKSTEYELRVDFLSFMASSHKKGPRRWTKVDYGSPDHFMASFTIIEELKSPQIQSRSYSARTQFAHRVITSGALQVQSLHKGGSLYQWIYLKNGSSLPRADFIKTYQDRFAGTAQSLLGLGLDHGILHTK